MNFTKSNYNDRQIDINESYNVIITSASPFITPTANNEISYAVDWASFLPDQPYDVHFTYLGGVNNLDGTKIANMFINFGTTNNTYVASNTVSSLNSNYVGILKPYVLGANSFLLSEDNTNPSIYIGGRPTNNVFTVSILDDSNVLFVPVTGALAGYRLNLKFTPAKSYKVF